MISKTAEKLEFDTGALRLYVNRDVSSVRPFIPALEVADYVIAKRHLEAAGCEIVHEWPGGKALYFKDPSGIVLDIVERSKAAKE